MKREEAIKFWKFRYENAKDYTDPHWEAQERREHMEYVEALRIAIEALSQPIVAKHFDIQSGYIYCSPQIAENVKVVVRCKDCRWYEQKQKNLPYNVSKRYCNRSCVLATKENDFCSYGERREP